MSLDLQSLAHVLANTFNPEPTVRKEAEAQLAQFEKVAGGHGVLLQLLSLPAEAGIPFEVKQAASLRLKNLYQGHWSVREGEEQRISDVDRGLVREAILEAILRQTDSRLRVQLLQVAYYLWPTQKPEEWPSLIPAIIANLQQGMSSQPPDLLRIYGCVCTLRMVFKRYATRPAHLRQHIFAITEQTFPLLLQIAQTLAALGPQATDETREILYILMKIFFLGSTLALPPSFVADFSKCVPWFDVMLFLLEAPVPGLESAGTTNPLLAVEKTTKSPGWKIKKWVSRTFLRIYSRWGRPKHVGQDKTQTPAERGARKAWATQFEAQYTTRVLGVLMGILKAKAEGAFVSDRVLHHCLSYIATSVDSAVHYKMLKPHLGFLVQDVVLRALMLDDTDLLLWKQDPHEFVRRQWDPLEEFYDPRMAAILLLNDLLQYRTRDSLQLTLNTIERVFEEYRQAAPEQRNFRLKEGAMHMFGSIKTLLMSESKFREGIENILVNHVLPEFASANGFMRSRANWCVRRYYKLVWKNKNAHGEAIRACVASLQDPELPVQMSAWDAVSNIIRQESVLEYLRDSLPAIMQAFYALFDEIGNDAVVATLEQLVDHFRDDVAPYALQLVHKLVETFLSLHEQTSAAGDDYDDDSDEAGSVQYQCVNTIVSVLYAIEKQPALYAQMLPPCCALLDVALQERYIEHYEPVLDIISVLVFQPEDGPIPECMWKYLPQICASWFDWAGDFLNVMLPVFDTFLAKGGDLLVSPQGQPLLAQMYKIAETILADENRLLDAARACTLIECILANLRGKVDPLLAPIVQLSAGRLLHLVKLEAEAAAARERKRAAEAKKKKKSGIKKGKKGAKLISRNWDEEEEEEESKEIVALKFGLLDNIAIAAHYNPMLFCQIIAQQDAAAAGQLFNVWLSHVNAMKNDFDVSKNAVLGLAALLHVSQASLPALWSDARPAVLGQLLFILREMSSILAEAEDDDDHAKEPSEREEMTRFHDIDEDADVTHPDDDGDAASEDVDEAAEDGDENAPDIMLDDMEDALLGMGDTDRFVSPLDDIDPFVFFAQTIEALSKSDPAFYQQWLSSLGAEGQTTLQAHMKQAEQHRLEIEEEKRKEEQEKLQAAAKQ